MPATNTPDPGRTNGPAAQGPAGLLAGLPSSRKDVFGRFAAWATRITGGKWAFLLATLTIIVWGLSGPLFHFSDTWQLVINTGTTIVTFLMVFLIQNSQNREARATHIKLDELIRALKPAKTELIDIEHLTDEQLDLLAQRYSRLAERHQYKLAATLVEAQNECSEVKPEIQRVAQKLDALHENLERVEEKVDSVA